MKINKNIDIIAEVNYKLGKKYLKGVKMKVYPILTIYDDVVNVEAVFTTKGDALRFVDNLTQELGLFFNELNSDVWSNDEAEIRIFTLNLSEDYTDE